MASLTTTSGELASSPSKFSSTSTSHLSPWRIKVVVEAERDDDNDGEDDENVNISPEVAAITPLHVTKRKQQLVRKVARTITVPLKGLDETEISEDTLDMTNNNITNVSLANTTAAAPTPKRGRGRPRKSGVGVTQIAAGSTTTKQSTVMTLPLRDSSTPATAITQRKATPGRKRAAESFSILEDDNDVSSTQNTETQQQQPQKRQRTKAQMTSQAAGNENSVASSKNGTKQSATSRSGFLRELSPNSSARAIHAPSPSPSRRSSSSVSNQSISGRPRNSRQANALLELFSSSANNSAMSLSRTQDVEDSILQSEGFSMIAPDSSILSSFSSGSGPRRIAPTSSTGNLISASMPPPPVPARENNFEIVLPLTPRRVGTTTTQSANDEPNNDLQTTSKRQRGRPPTPKRPANTTQTTKSKGQTPAKKKRGRPSKAAEQVEPARPSVQEDEELYDETEGAAPLSDEMPGSNRFLAGTQMLGRAIERIAPNPLPLRPPPSRGAVQADPYLTLHTQVKDSLRAGHDPYTTVHDQVKAQLASSRRPTRSHPGEMAGTKVSMIGPSTRATTPKRDIGSKDIRENLDKNKPTREGNLFTRTAPAPTKAQEKRNAEFLSFLNHSAYVVPGSYDETTHFERSRREEEEENQVQQISEPVLIDLEEEEEDISVQMLPDNFLSDDESEDLDESPSRPVVAAANLPQTPERQRSQSVESTGTQSVRWASPIAGVSAKKHSPKPPMDLRQPTTRLLDGVKIVEPHRPKAGLLADGSKKPLVVVREWDDSHWKLLNGFLFPKSLDQPDRMRSMKPFYERETPMEADASRRRLLETMFARDEDDALTLSKQDSRAIDKFEGAIKREIVGPKKLPGETRREWGFSRSHIREAVVIAKIGRERRKQWVLQAGGNLEDWGLE